MIFVNFNLISSDCIKVANSNKKDVTIDIQLHRSEKTGSYYLSFNCLMERFESDKKVIGLYYLFDKHKDITREFDRWAYVFKDVLFIGPNEKELYKIDFDFVSNLLLTDKKIRKHAVYENGDLKYIRYSLKEIIDKIKHTKPYNLEDDVDRIKYADTYSNEYLNYDEINQLKFFNSTLKKYL